MISCIAIDDEPLALKQICNYIAKIPYLVLHESFSSPIRALEYLKNNKIDLIFVDINMPKLSGIELVKSIKTDTKVIFTTAHREFAVEGFEVDAVDYLVKPISFEKFSLSVEKTKSKYFLIDNKQKNIVDNNFLFIKSEYKIVRIDFKDILYIKSMGDYIQINLINKSSILTLMTIKKIIEDLPKDSFMRVHRSFIVNLKKITTIEKNRIVFDDIYIPISNQYKKDFQKFVDNFFSK